MNTLLLSLFGLFIASYGQTIVEIAASKPEFSYLVGALKINGLDTVLSGAGPYTVFAPTNAAFMKLGLTNTTIDALTLKNHVVSGNVSSSDLVPGQTITTLAVGFDLTFSNTSVALMDSNGRYINITMVDVYGTNGVIHFIDTIILPGDVVDYVISDDTLNVLESAVVKAGLVATLKSAGPFTILAPTNDSLNAIPTIGLYISDTNTTNLEMLLKYHVIPAKVLAKDLMDGAVVTTVQGRNITVSTTNGAAFMDYNGKKCFVKKADIVRGNGVVHIIDCTLTYNSIVDVVIENSNLSTLKGALVAAGLTTALSGVGPFTVFAPTNTAFTNTMVNLTDPTIAKYTLKYHVVPGVAAPAATVLTMNDAALATLFMNVTLDVNITNGMVYIRDTKGYQALVTTPNLYSTNGIIHITDYVFQYGTVVDYVVGSTILTTLETAVIAAQLATVLSGAGPFTILAPTDTAFAALGSAKITELLAAPNGTLTMILKYHVISGKVMAGDLTNGQVVETLQGGFLTVKIVNGSTMFMDETGAVATVTQADKVGTNGVVHIINKVLLLNPNATVVDYVVASPMLTTLETAVTTAQLVTTLSGTGPFTILAPTDAAFAALPNGTLNALLADPMGQLTMILKYHVISGKVMAAGLTDGQIVTTLQGGNLTVKLVNGMTKFMDETGAVAIVTKADIVQSNGVIHIIDKVLLLAGAVPTTTMVGTVVDYVVASPILTTLETAVVAAQLVTTLSGTGPFTILAPTDTAFAALPNGTLDTLLADPMGQLKMILKYHVIAGKVMAASLTNGQIVPTLQGGNLTVKLVDGKTKFMDETGAVGIVTQADIVKSNGVIHIIDKVLLLDTATTTTTMAGSAGKLSITLIVAYLVFVYILS